MKPLTGIGVYAALLCASAIAGPPMICHPIEIGAQSSLPWNSSGDAWDGRQSGYDRTKLVADTLQLLRPETPVLARMETLRRAAIYTDRAELAKDLADRLTARTQESKPDPMAAFDAGFFIEAIHQLKIMRNVDLLPGRDGYTLAKQSLATTKDAAAVEYALSLMAPRFPNEHFQRAKAGAKEGSPLAANLRLLESR